MEKEEEIVAALLAAVLLCGGCLQTQMREDEVVYMDLTVSSPAFGNNSRIPAKYTCDGEDVNPPLNVSGIPPKTKSLALIVDDPDAPRGTFVHWVVYNIPPTGRIGEDTVPGVEGTNSGGGRSYGGPCPPPGTHRYFFKVYALDTELRLESGIGKDRLLEAMKGHVLAVGELVGLYSRGG